MNSIQLKTDLFKESCTAIKNAIDSKNVTLFNETLNLNTQGNILYLNITNREYFCKVKFILDSEATFSASVNAKLFLDLVSKTTSDTITLTTDGKTVNIIGNGNYKIPIIFNNDVMLELPEITLSNVTCEMNIDSKILQDILLYNSKELQRGIIAKPVQAYFYIDNYGAITFTSGACVNNFTLEKPIKILLSEKVVKLFKLFKDTSSVKFTMAQDKVSDDLIQTKVLFESDTVALSAILADCSLVSTVPVDAIRTMATKNYLYSIVIKKDDLAFALDRLMLFNSDKNYGRFVFSQSQLSISDWSGKNSETILVNNDAGITTPYSAIINMNNLSLVLAGCRDEYITICFGDSKAFVIKKQNISDIIPELKEA